jgi:tape measure domain-containing protein
MAVEYDRLVAVFETDTSRSLRPVQQLDTATGKYETTVTKTGKSLDRLTSSTGKQSTAASSASQNVTKMSSAVTKLDDEQKKLGKDTDENTKKLGLMGRAANTLNSGLAMISGRSGGMTGGGLIPGLANISSIIRGIPQIGQLAGAIVRPLTDAAEEGVRLNFTLEAAEIGFSQVAGSADKAHQHVQNLLKFGAASPFRFEGLLEASRLMTAMGFEIDEQIPKLKVWGAAIASSGELSADSVHRVVLAFGQMRMAGRVNAQDMLQLTNANIPGWELLARSIGKTVAETRKMAEAGKLNGKVAVEAMTAMMAADPRYKGMLDRLQSTGFGRLSAAQDLLQIAGGVATKGLADNVSKTLEDVLSKQDLVGTIAAQLNTAITPASALIETAIRTTLSGGIISGISDGISAGKAAVTKVMMDFAGDSIIGTVKDVLGMHSPSTVFIAMGEQSALSYRDGFVGVMGQVSNQLAASVGDIFDQIDGVMQSKGRHFINPQERSRANLDRLTQREPGFMEKLIAGSRARGMNPDHLLNVMAVETSGTFSPSIKNPNSSASGLIQFMDSTAKQLGTTTAAIRAMSATQQLDLVFKYFDQYIRRYGALDTQGKVYAAVGAGRVASDDEGVVMRRGDAGYMGNRATWDRNLDGIIRQGEMAIAAFNKLGAGVNFTVNNVPVSTTNPVPVVLASTTSGRALLEGAGYDKRVLDFLYGTGGGQKREPTMDDLFKPSRPSGPAIVNVPIGQPDLIPTMSAAARMMDASMLRLRPLLPLIVEDTKELAADMSDANRTTAEWYKRMTSMGGAIQQLGQYMDGVKTLGDLMTDEFVSIPDKFGDAMADAMQKSDGTVRGFLSALRQNVLSTFQQIAADVVKNQMTKAAGSLLQGLLGTEVHDAKTGDATGEIKGGSSIFRSILGIFGIKAGGAAGDKTGQSAAVATNTASTDRNTLALDRNTMAQNIGGAGVAGAVTGGKSGGGFWSTVLNTVIGGVLGGVSIGGGGTRNLGGGSTYTPGGTGATRPRFAVKHATGGFVRAGSSVVVGDSPFGAPNPELFTPAQDGQITPSGKGEEMHLHVHNHFHTQNGRVPQESMEQAAMRTVGAVDRYHKRRGSQF